MMKFFTAYKVQFSRRELGIMGDEYLGNPYLTDRRNNRYRLGSHISEEDDSFYSSRSTHSSNP
jgi:hypothetical protein